VRAAIVMVKRGVGAQQARELLQAAHNRVHRVLNSR
jgi:N-acetylmuramic acid 6-phosphate (MurNAc-6-P) etherase